MSKDKELSVDEIRHSDFLAGQAEAIKKDIEFLLEKKSSFVNVSCPACQSDKFEQRFEKNGFSYTTCQVCRTFFMNPRPPDSLLAEFYEKSANYKYWNKYIFPASAEARRNKIFIPRVDMVIDLCKKHKVAGGSLLEIGSGYGTFCEEVMTRNFFSRVVAVEPSADLADTCRDKKITVIDKPIEQINFNEDELFDVVVHFEVIEHIFSPRDFISKCRKFLKPGGLMMLTCPNGEGFDVSLLGTKSDTVDHEHLNYFNPDSLSLLLVKEGFQTITKITPGRLDAELVHNKIVSGDYDVSNDAFLKKVLVDDWEKMGAPFQNFLSENLLSSNMLLVGRAV